MLRWLLCIKGSCRIACTRSTCYNVAAATVRCSWPQKRCRRRRNHLHWCLDCKFYIKPFCFPWFLAALLWHAFVFVGLPGTSPGRTSRSGWQRSLRIHACPFVPSQILCSQDSLSLWTNSSMPRSASFGSSFKVLFDSGHDCFIRIKNRVPRRYMIYGIQGPSQAAKTSFAKQLFQKPFVVTVQNSTTLNLKDFVYGHHDALCFGKAWQVFFVWTPRVRKVQLHFGNGS